MNRNTEVMRDLQRMRNNTQIPVRARTQLELVIKYIRELEDHLSDFDGRMVLKQDDT